MESKSTSPAEKFAEAALDWDLERLYVDFAKAKKVVAPHKKRELTHTEKERLRGLLCGYSPAEMARKLHLSPGGIQVAISDLYRYAEILTQRPVHTIKNWRDIVEWLEAAGYKKAASQTLPPSSSPPKQNWESAPDISHFYGRRQELSTLKQWIGQEQCRLVAILGMGGIGKTALAVKVAKELAEEFESVIWHSLSYTPPFPKTLAKLLSFFSHIPTTTLPSVSEGISQLIENCQRHRCLLILDGLEGMLQPGELAGHYSPEHQAYQELIKRMGEENHRSCLMITSQEKTPELAALSGSVLPVRCFSLMGLDTTAAQAILKDKGLPDQKNTQQLINLYRGNPLALKIVSTTIQDFFNGNIDDFLRSSSIFLGDFAEILSQQFQRLSSIEKQILYALSLERNSVTFFQLRDILRHWASTSKLTQAGESLNRRSLLEKTAEGFTLQPVVMKFVTEQLIKQICNEALVAKRTQKLENNSLLQNQLLLQFQPICQNDDKVFNYRKILLKVENELRVFLQDTESERLEEQLSELLSVIPKPSVRV
ncbi:MAG TPA: NACHT domain-containing protein [Coleofasciculaceae cyanobacterium]